MNLFLKKSQPIYFILSVIFLAFILNACGTANPDLLGAAGQNSSQATETPVAEETIEAPTIAPEEPTATPIPPATGRIIFSSNRDGQNDLYMIAPDGTGEATRLTFNASVDSGYPIRTSPDGTKVAFSATFNDNTDIYALDIASGSITRITDAAGKDTSPSWSPNSRQIAFESFSDGNLEIYIVNADGSNLARLTNDPAGDSAPLWSPTSNEILFSSNRFGNSDLFLLSLNGSVSTLTTNPAPDNAAAWSPDGNWIAFQSFSGKLSNVCVIRRLDLTQFCFSDSAEYGAPVWSPDGNWIASAALLNNSRSITLFNPSTHAVEQIISPDIEPYGVPSWSPDGLRIVFQARIGEDMEIYSILLQTREITRVTPEAGYNGAPVWIN